MITDQNILDKYNRFSSWVKHSNELISTIGHVELTQKDIFALASLQLCQEHARAVLMLVKGGLIASALTLLRPQLDALLRGWWLYAAIDDETFQRDHLDKQDFPSGNKKGMINSILNALNSSDRKIFENHLVEAQDFYNDFSHGGFEQLARRLRKNGVVSYTDTNSEIYECLASSMLYDGLSKTVTCRIFNNSDLHIKLQELGKKYSTKIGSSK
ncbi:hypothetical protein IB233_02135 [Comamonas sp. CMM01]|uniref:DUF6988 family protein n=1 Tax=Comamonas sp. CMM01 TaxID=2769280 RepID=UPI0017874D09|nr:hypothetical protein [Comamonas sp. CMM01]MBD9530431.1 hypothetical protein [Comamonas sp. CMM01]